MWEQLHRWARHAPTALVDPLPTGIWRHVGVDLVYEGVELPPVPALSLSPRSLGQWARVLMRGSPEGCDALLVAAQDDTFEPRPPEPLPCAHVAEYMAGLLSGISIPRDQPGRLERVLDTPVSPGR